jgi:sugar/nucleoside kinase (ribokinase family)
VEDAPVLTYVYSSSWWDDIIAQQLLRILGIADYFTITENELLHVAKWSVPENADVSSDKVILKHIREAA